MSNYLIEHYLAQAQAAEETARISHDPKIIKTLREEAARYLALVEQLEPRQKPGTETEG